MMPVSARPIVAALLLTTVLPVQVRADKVDDAVRRGVDFLLRTQNEDGSFGPDKRKHKTAMTSLSLLAMAAVGRLPANDTEAGHAVRRGVDFILQDDRQNDNGYYGHQDDSRMYGHGITTLMLSALLGMGADAEQDDLIRQRLEKAIDLILLAQNTKENSKFYGGWRYRPGSNQGDMSLTCWQLMALRSANNAGLEIPSEAIDRAVVFLKNCYYEKSRQFTYRPGQKGGRYSDTSMAVLSLQVSGRYEAKEVIQASDWLLKYDLNWSDKWFLYGTYYYAQGMYQRGGAHADHAEAAVAQMLLPRQREDGSWRGKFKNEQEPVYATAMALLALSVKYHYLPIYQR